MPDEPLPPADSPLPPDLLPFTSPPTGFLASDFIERLEQAWIAWRKDKAQPLPNLMDFLPAETGVRDRIIPPLAEVHFEHGLDDAVWDRVETFLERYPDLKSHVEVLAALIGLEIRHRRDSGEAVSDDEYWQRFPPFAALQVRDDFEEALREGKSPAIEDYLQDPRVPRPLVLQHLVALDLDERLRRREHVRLEEYLTRFPDVSGESEAIADLLLLEYEGRGRVESDIPFAEYEKRFPQAYPPLARRLRIPRIEGFTILSQLGRGGMGRVYKAREDRLGGRLVAIKVILASALQQSDALRRFQREAEATAQIEHPNIARVYQVGHYETEQGGCLPYLVMEYVPGGTLAAAMGGRPQNQRDAAETVECLALAVHAAHQRGIIHRDLKPQNVLLGPEPKITDFGLAKLVDQDATLTQGQLLGTPGYMAPEQVKTKEHPVSPATDVWALGAILYDALTGRPPFQAPRRRLDVFQSAKSPGIAAASPRGDDPDADGTTSILYRTLHDEPVRPRRLEKAVDPHLEAICLKCLEKKPKDRFASAEALAEELRRFLNHEKPTIKPVTRWSEFRRWCRRNPVIAGAAAIVFLVVMASAIWSNYARIVAEAAKLEANHQQRKAEANEALAKHNEQKAADLATKESKQRKRAELEAYGAHIAAAQRAWKSRCGELALAHLDAAHWNQRGWEHDCLYTQFTSGYRAFYGHSEGVHCVAFSPDGMRLASGDGNNVVKLWDVSNTSAIATIRTKKAGNDSVTALAFSPDGARVVGGFGSGAILVWNLTGQVVSTLAGHTDLVSCVSFSPDGNHVLSGSEDKSARLWDATNGKLVHTFSGNREAVNAVAFSPDGTHIASGSRNGQIRLWAAASKQLLHSIEYDNKRLRGMSYDEDGAHILAIHDDLVTMWSVELAEKVDEWHVPVLSRSTYHFPVAFSSGATAFAFCNLKSGGISVFGNIGILQKELFILREMDFSCLAFSPDGNRIVTGGGHGDLKLWDLDNLNNSIFIRDLKAEVRQLAISQDGQYLAAALTSQTNAVPVWNTATGRRVATLGDPSTPQVQITPAVFGVAVSPDGTFVATACQDKTLRLWSVADRKEVKVLQGHAGFVVCVAYSLDGARILSGSRDNTAKLWDSNGGNVVTLRGHEGAVTCVAFSPDGQRCLTGSTDCTVRLWDVLSGKELATFRSHSKAVAHVAFRADGKQFVSEGIDSALKVWDADVLGDDASRHPRLAILTPPGACQGVAFSPNGERIINGEDIYDAHTGLKVCTLFETSDRTYSGFNGTTLLGSKGRLLVRAGGPQIQLTSVERHQEVSTPSFWGNRVRAVAVSPDGSLLAAGDDNCVIELVDLQTGQEYLRLSAHNSPIACVAFSRDGKLLATGSEDGRVAFWEVATGRMVRAFQGQSGSVLHMKFASDNDRVFVGSSDGTVKLWDMRTGALTLMSTFINEHQDRPICIAISPDCEYVAAVGAWTGEVLLFCGKTGARLSTLSGHTGDVVSLAFSADGKQLATGSRDSTIRLWDVGRKQGTAVLRGHSDRVTAIAFSPDAKLIASGSADSTLVLWDARRGVAVQRLQGHTDTVTDVTFTPDGMQLVSGARDEKVKVWSLKRQASPAQ